MAPRRKGAIALPHRSSWLAGFLAGTPKALPAAARLVTIKQKIPIREAIEHGHGSRFVTSLSSEARPGTERFSGCTGAAPSSPKIVLCARSNADRLAAQEIETI
jgi:hypothetical protein